MEAIEERERRDLAPALRAWFSHEVGAEINCTLQSLDQRTLAHPTRTTAN